VRGELTHLLTRQSLAKVKTRALRQRIWFKTLSRMERDIMDLTIKCVERVQSRVLARTILVIVRKMLKTLEENFMRRAERVGYEIAQKLCAIGERWGNKDCCLWKRDKYFMRFLGANTLNT
jgi:uncharacterized membrane-anchored protein YjiN (DUF445 family)